MARNPISAKLINPVESKINTSELSEREEYEPDYNKQTFKCPKNLDAVAKKRWKEIKAIFLQMRNCPITDADSVTMAIHCQAWSNYLKYDSQIKEDPSLYLVRTKLDKDGNTVEQIVKNINYDLRHKEALVVLATTKDLCLDVISRARVGKAKMKAKKDGETSLMNLLMNRKGDNDQL